MRIAVLDFLKSFQGTKQEKYNQALILFSQTSQNPNLLRAYNSRIYTESNLESIIYDLKRCNAISEGEILKHTITKKDIVSENPTSQNNADHKSYQERLADKSTLDVFSNVIKTMNNEQKTGFTMASSYPFLLEKDCPVELQALSTQSVNSYHSYRAAHEKLFEEVANTTTPKMSNVEIYALASQLLEDFFLNREIHAELEHYAKNKTFLGEHEIFAEWKKEKNQSELSPAELAQKIKNIGPNISKERRKLQGANRQQKSEINAKIKALETERAELQKKLDAK